MLSTLSLCAQKTTEGTDFWFGFMDSDNPRTLSVYVSSRTGSIVNASAPLGSFFTTVTVAPNSSVRIDIPRDLLPRNEGIHDKAIHITSDSPIVVYSLNEREFSADAAIILPTDVLGGQYFAMAHVDPNSTNPGADLESELLIVATEDATEVDIIPSSTTFEGLAANTTTRITLNAGQSYQLKSNGDLSGTKVDAVIVNGVCPKLAVFGGNKFTTVGGCGGNSDHLIEQILPLHTWGKEYLYVPFETRLGGDMVKIMAAYDDTNIDISGNSSFTLNAGQTRTIPALDGVRSISSNKGIQVAQLSRSESCDAVPADPFMLMLSPMEQKINEIVFDAFDVDIIDQYYITLATRSDAFNDVLLDGVNVSGEFTVVGDQAFAKIDVEKGAHQLIAPEGAIAYVYGFGRSKSLGYSGGIALENINNDIEITDPQIGVTDEACLNSPLTFEFIPIISLDSFTDFEWDFGDGTTLTGGVNVSHTYTTPGDYLVQVQASGGNGCSDVASASKTITIEDFEVEEITGPISVCPDATGITYEVDNVAGRTYKWSVFGGTIVGSDSESQVTIDWGAARNDAKVSVVVTSSLGCEDDTELIVSLNSSLIPPLPEGPVELCFEDSKSAIYSTPKINGSTFEWFVTNGNILSGGNDNEVEVEWTSAGTGQIWYEETNGAISGCKGVSGMLTVTIYSEISTQATVNTTLCHGDAQGGSILLDISGGAGGYQVQWSNGETGLSIENLSPGDYMATITDQFGCSMESVFEVTEPPLLEVGVIISDVICFGEGNGAVEARITGGTSPYSLIWDGNTPTDELIYNNIFEGSHTLVVRDANGCEFNTTFQVDQPEPLSAITFDTPTCPNEDTGMIFVEASGGTPPYTYRWNTRPPQDAQLIKGLPSGVYSVTVTDANGCSFTFDHEEISERAPRIRLPNAFSPNNDGMNDTFAGVYDCSSTFQMRIYSQWGEVIFFSDDIDQGWDGTYRGKELPVGTYAYVVSYSAMVNDRPFNEVVRGTIRLIR